MPPKSIEQLRKEVKALEKSKKEKDERMKLEAKLKSLKISKAKGKISRFVPTKKTRKGIVSILNRGASSFGFD